MARRHAFWILGPMLENVKLKVIHKVKTHNDRLKLSHMTGKLTNRWNTINFSYLFVILNESVPSLYFAFIIYLLLYSGKHGLFTMSYRETVSSRFPPKPFPPKMSSVVSPQNLFPPQIFFLLHYLLLSNIFTITCYCRVMFWC